MPLIAMLTLLTLLLSLGSVGGKTTVTQPETQPVYVKSGDTLNLTCEQSDGFKVHWLKSDHGTWDYKMIDSNNATGMWFLSQVINKQVAQLIKENVTLSDEGSYRCAVQSGYDMPYAVEVYVIHVEEKPGLITHLGNTTTIGCVISTVEMVRVEAYWTRGDKEITSDTIRSGKFTTNASYSDNTTEFTLTVKNVGEADVGIYQCNIKLKNGNKFIHNVSLYAHPQVKSMGRSKNLVAGLTLELVCEVWGWPLPNVTWEFEKGRPLNWSDNRISVSSNGTLKIENVADNDRAVYVCIGWNDINKTRQQTSTSILVRVKGKLAILWPLLGIALEMVILSCIIYIYERKRARQRAEQERKEAADHQSAPSSTPAEQNCLDRSEKRGRLINRSNSNAQPRHQGRDNVRYRK